jgi:hypothetical protein
VLVRNCYLCDRAEARDAGRKGRGVFATTVIPAGTTVAAFGGYVCGRAELDALTDERRAHSIQIDDDLYMVGADAPEPADFVNHSCAPNAGIVGNILLVAMRDIGAGEEICLDYAMCDAADYDEFVCACADDACRRVVTSADWKRPELRERYRGWRSSYLQRRLDADERAHAPTQAPTQEVRANVDGPRQGE